MDEAESALCANHRHHSSGIGHRDGRRRRDVADRVRQRRSTNDTAGSRSSHCNRCDWGHHPELRGRSNCSSAKQVSANRGSRPHSWNASPPNRTRACAISARRSAPTARSTRSSARSNAPPDWRTTTTRRRELDKLDAVLARTSTSPEDAALFAEMLSLPNDGRYPALELAPEQRRQRVLEALMSQLAGLARQQPVLMIFEDVHWVDPTSLEVLGRIVDRIQTLPALLIVTFRPELEHSISGAAACRVDEPDAQPAWRA